MKVNHSMIQFRKKQKIVPHIELTSLIDIIFILLVFFMVSSTFLKPVMKIRLPVSATKEKMPEQKTVQISLMENGDIYLNDKRTVLPNLQYLVEEEYQNEIEEIAVLFYCESSVTYESIFSVMDILKKAGVRNIALAHEEP